MDKNRLSDRLEEVQNYFEEAQKHLFRFREKNAKNEFFEKNIKEKIDEITRKFGNKKEKLLATRKDKEEIGKNLNKIRIRQKEIVKILKNSKIHEKILENKLSQIENA